MPLLLVILQFSCIAVLLFGGGWALPWWAWLLFTTGLVVFFFAAAALGGNNFTVMPVPREDNTLSVRGIYRYVRHPMYTAVLLCGAAVTFGSFNSMRAITLVICAVVLVFKIHYEERALTLKHPDYPQRMKGVARLLPFVW